MGNKLQVHYYDKDSYYSVKEERDSLELTKKELLAQLDAAERNLIKTNQILYARKVIENLPFGSHEVQWIDDVTSCNVNSPLDKYLNRQLKTINELLTLLGFVIEPDSYCRAMTYVLRVEDGLTTLVPQTRTMIYHIPTRKVRTPYEEKVVTEIWVNGLWVREE